MTFSRRSEMRPVCDRIRAYFAPVDRETSTPAVFDAARDGNFDLSVAPAGWLDGGVIESFERKSATEHVLLSGGEKEATRKVVRRKLAAAIHFRFCDWGKLQMALSSGSQQMNLLEEVTSAEPQGSGGAAQPPRAVMSGSTASEVVVGLGNTTGFAAGDLVVVDVNYQQESGYVGSGIAGAFVKTPADVGFDADYIRRISFNVGRVASVTANSLQLAAPLPAGIPANAQLQRLNGFVDREGGSFHQEWSALFVAEEASGGRLLLHYPRVQAATGADEITAAIDGGPYFRLTQPVRLMALPAVDNNDNELVLCYRAYLPTRNAAIY